MIIGVASGALAFALGMPLPWMLGPMIGTTIAAMLALPVRGPDRLRPIVIPIIGVMLGSAMTADVFDLLGNWVLTLVLLPIFLLTAAGFSYIVYRRIGGFDPVTAFYAAMPGGMNEMMLMGGEAGGDERRIALAHAARVLIVILFVVLFFALVLGVTSSGQSRTWIALGALDFRDYAILIFCAAAGVPLANLARLPAAQVFGPMILSGAAHIVGLVAVAPPTVFVIAAQLVMGTIIGARFVGASAREISRDLGLAIVASIGMLLVAVAFALIISAASGMALSQAFLAYSPGGLTEMSLLTLSMGQDITYVSVTHIVRITFIIGIAPMVFSLLRRR